MITRSINYYFAILLILAISFVPPTISTPILPEGIHTLHVGNFQSETSTKSQEVFSYYDYNHDEYCDVLSVVTNFSPDNKKVLSQYLVLYLWNEKEQMFVKSADVNLAFMNVRSIISTQLYHRNTHQTDLVIVYDYAGTQQTSSTQQRYSIHFMKIIYNPDTKKSTINSSFDPIAAVTNIDGILPTVVVLQGRISVLYRKNNEAFVLYFLFGSTGEVTHQVQSLVRSKKYLVMDQNTIGNLSYQLGYFGDYNADGIADLLIAQKTLSTINNKQYTRIHFFKYDKVQLKFVLEKTFQLKATQQQLSTSMKYFTLHDINYDGKIDLVILFSSGVIQVHYNTQQPSRTQLIIENSQTSFPFDLYEQTESSMVKIQRLKLTNYLPSERSTLLFGDFNLDGFDDLIVDYEYDMPTGEFDKNGAEIVKKAEKSLLLINTACVTVSDCGDSTFNSKFLKTLDLFSIRKFTILNTLPTSYKTSQSYKMFFIDLFKDGKLDLISHKLSANSSYVSTDNKLHRSSQIEVYYNNEHYDAFFMKVRVMRGNDNQDIHNNLVLPGGNVNCFVTSLGGQMLPKVGNQYSQLGSVIQLPYVFFGLGRTNNYVNQLTVTIPYVCFMLMKVSAELAYTFMWTPIIPNSQILTLANPEGAWHLSAFIQPTKKMATVSVLVILALAVIGVVICRLTIQEKNQDKENLQSFYTILR